MGIENSIELLGDSQTFLGVLATIVLLFIYTDKSINVILRLLEEVEKKFSIQLESLKENKVFNKCQDLFSIVEKENENQELKEDGKKLASDIMAEYVRWQHNFLSASNYKTFSEKIGKAQEIKLAPLYTVLFCLTVFIYDELLNHFGSTDTLFSSFLLSSLAIFILLSFLLWILLWSIFVINFHNTEDNAEKETRKKKFTKWIDIDNNKYINSKHFILKTYIIRPLLLLVYFIVVIYFCHIFCSSSTIVIVILGIVLPTILKGILRTHIRRKKGGYTELFVCGHYIVMILMAILFTATILFFVRLWNSADLMLFSTAGCQWFKLFIFIFVLLNGIICPFMIPYGTYYYLYRDSKKKAEEDNKKLEDKFLKRIKELCEKHTPRSVQIIRQKF